MSSIDSSIDRRPRLATLVVIVLGAAGCGGSLGGAGPGAAGGLGKGTGSAGASGPGGRSGLGAIGGNVGIAGSEGLGGGFGTGAGGSGGGFGSGVGGSGDGFGTGAGGSGRPVGGAGGTGAATGGVTGTGGSMCMHRTAGEVPSEHRPMPPTCPSNPPVPLASGGVPACATGSDCTSQGYGSCTAGQCVSDFCLADGDCQKGYVCACGGRTVTVSPPGAATDAASQDYPVNTCVPATCRMDSDCGPQGYCSPSYTCGTVQGYYCHGPADTCADAAKDCCGSQECFWSAPEGAFVCAVELCIE